MAMLAACLIQHFLKEKVAKDKQQPRRMVHLGRRQNEEGRFHLGRNEMKTLVFQLEHPRQKRYLVTKIFKTSLLKSTLKNQPLFIERLGEMDSCT